jgi:Fe-S cluster biogenesis protein NfuA
MEDQPFAQRMQRIEALIQEAEQLPDPSAQTLARELVQALLELHGAGFSQVLGILERSGPAGRDCIEACAADGLVSSLLLLHGVHPLDMETRVQRALEKVRPYLRSHGGDVELLAIGDGAVRLRMQGSCNGCPSSAQTLKNAIEEAICEAAPDVIHIEVEGAVAASTPAPANGLISLPVLGSPSR